MFPRFIATAIAYSALIASNARYTFDLDGLDLDDADLHHELVGNR
jgi:hypothetical protein